MTARPDISFPDDLRALTGSRAALTPLMMGDINAFTRGRVHEATGPTRTALALCLGASTPRAVFWTGQQKASSALRAQGVARFFDPARLIRLETGSRKETLWAGEEALRCKGAGLVVLQMESGPDLFESRRLQIAAQAGGGIGLVLIGRSAHSSAAQTRWHCTSHNHSHPQSLRHEHNSQWLWELTKNKGGPLGLWSARWTDQETGNNAELKPHDLILRARAARLGQPDCEPKPASGTHAHGIAETTPCIARPATAVGSMAPA